MPTKTKQILDALGTVLSGAANCPPVARNQVLPAHLASFRDVCAFASLNDGDADIQEELLGTADYDSHYELAHTATLMLAFEAEDAATRDDVFDDALLAIEAGLNANRTLGVSDDVFARLVALEQEAALANPDTGLVFRMAELSIEVTFASTTIF